MAPYSSGKVVTQDKFSFKYGRIDYCAKLPTGIGIWPALWMMPNDSVYGTWASSGEIDVMEARGRVPNTVCGTIHYGSTWPGNKNAGEDYHFPEGSTFDDGFHVYSCVWSKEDIRWYVDGNCYSVIGYEEWYSGAVPNNPYAPFDQEFFIIMNLAAGGWFDGGVAPTAADIPCEMQVEYVRVYQAEGDTTGSYRNNGGGVIVTPQPTDPQPSETETEPVKPSETETEPSITVTETETEPSVTVTETETEPVIVVPSDEPTGITYSNGTATLFVNDVDPKGFAIVHFNVNKGGDMNVGMNAAGNGRYTFDIPNLQPGDVIDYNFTYVPNGRGAMDTARETYVVPAVAVEPTETETETETEAPVIEAASVTLDKTAAITVKAAAKPFNFTDVKRTDWFYFSVKEAYELGIMSGYSDSTFRPMESMNRAMVVTVLHRMAGYPKAAYKNLFSDVPSGQYYTSAVMWAAQNKVVNGYADGTFHPMANVTREQLVTMLMNFAKAQGLDVSQRVNLSVYKDANQISSYATTGLSWAIANGIMSGTGTGELNPKREATRAEGAKMFLNFYKLLNQ